MILVKNESGFCVVYDFYGNGLSRHSEWYADISKIYETVTTNVIGHRDILSFAELCLRDNVDYKILLEFKDKEDIKEAFPEEFI